MAGSLRWMVYSSDDGSDYAVKMDKSNAEALGFTAFADGGDEKPLPRGTRMRGINVVNEDGARRFFPVGKADDPNFDGTNTKVTIDDTEWYISSVRGEKAVRPLSLDTGDTDDEGEGGGA